ncbi:hypothetical protein KQX54_014496 [Cotesia glomerata]|uniref:RING-type domain-containing protein n=1 Tax=Cotesia glomerata TaxID=32391 RepID=A0AAV7HX81_COTGL|nr:hypothetical protein KQX54_014496 [Cotesia glomerata]
MNSEWLRSGLPTDLIMINTAESKNIDLEDERTMSILSKITSISLLLADKIVNGLQEFVDSMMRNEDFENLKELMEFYDQKWLKSIDVENYSFYNDSMSLWKNGELILQNIINRLKKINTLWNLIEIEAGVLFSIDFIMRTADNLTPILRNLLRSDVKIPVQFELLDLSTNEENELIDADELPILNSSDDEPIDTLDEEEEDQWYIYSQHCLGCYEDSIEIGYKPCTHAPYCWSCNEKWRDKAVRNGEIFICILCRSAVEITKDLRKD